MSTDRVDSAGHPRFVRRESPASVQRREDSSLIHPVLEQGARRLRLLSGGFGALFTVGWLGIATLEGGISHLLREFTDPAEAIPASTVVVSSFLVYSLIRSGRLTAGQIARLGLVYEVVMAYGLVGVVYVGSYHHVPAEQVGFDHVGFSPAIPWMFLVTTLVPNEPRHVLLAVLGCVSAPPVVFGACIVTGLAPALDAGSFLGTFVLPNLLVGACAYATARVIHRFGSDLKRARELGSYRLESLLGRGGMGEVWRATHNMLARPAAVKIIRPDRHHEDPVKRRTLFERFEREAQVTATLTSHHTVQLYDFGVSDDGAFYYVMELLDGVDLDTAVRSHGPLPAERVVALLRQTCHSLAEAHARGLVHRDIKPANLFLSRRGLDVDVLKVLDFGLVGGVTDHEVDARLTDENTVTGTPATMAPEVVSSRNYDARVDIYALGCCAFYMLTGRFPFEEASAMATIVAHSTREPPDPASLTEQPVPEALTALVLDCLRKSPERRVQNVADLDRRLAEVPVERPWTEERARAWWDAHYPE